MEYYRLLNLEREPFSNSPDPAFFYPSGQHRSCLQQLELAIRLRRGLNVVTGPVGTGKTTLCRDLIRRMADDDAMDAFLLLDPGASSESAFLATVLTLLTGTPPPGAWTEERRKEAIKHFLFTKAVEDRRTITLIVDEGQKLSPSCLEVLRELLNYETNDHKLLQMVIFAQTEFDHRLRACPNFADRINLRLALNPLGLRDTMALIRYRIGVAGGGPAARLFSRPAQVAIFLTTRGYPRRIIHLCHRILLALIIQNKGRAGWRLVRASARRAAACGPTRLRRLAMAAGTLALTGALVWAPDGWLRMPSTFVAPTAAPGVHSPQGAAETPITNAAVKDAGEKPRGPEAAPHPSVAVAGKTGARASSLFAAERPLMQPAETPATVTPPSMPARLGRLSIAPGETLGQLIQMIYGRFTPAYLNAIAQANPHLPDPDTLDVGDVIHFPALPAAVQPLPVPVWWVQLAEHRRLDRALLALQQIRRNGIAARLLPYWNPDQGLIFALVLRDCFFDPQAARNALERTAAAAGSGSAIRSLWRDDTVFFSNPFQAEADRPANHS